MDYFIDAIFSCDVWTNETSSKLIRNFESLVEELVTNFGTDTISNENTLILFCKILSLKKQFTNRDLNIISKLCCRYLKEYLCSCLKSKSSAGDVSNQTMVLKSIELSLETVINSRDDKFCEEFIQIVLRELNSELGSSEQKHKILTALDSFLNAMMTGKEDSNTNDLKETLFVLRTYGFHSSLAEIAINSENEAVPHFILFKVGLKLVKVSQEQTIMEVLWRNTEKSLKLDLLRKMIILSGLMNFFLVNQTNCLTILREPAFWNVIQEGLVSNDSKLRKYGLYLLKRSVENIEVSNLDVAVDNFQWTPLKSESLKFSWENVFIILEILEEKQAHLVIPVVQSTLKAIDHPKEIHHSWVLCIYRRIFSHDSLQVIKEGIVSFLTLNIEYYLECFLFKTTFEVLFHKLNNMLLFVSPSGNGERPVLAKSLQEWFSCIQNLNLKNRTECFHGVVDAMAKVQWCTIPLFHILHNMRLVISEVHIDNENKLDILSEFLREVIRTQNVFVRGAVQVEILYFLSWLRPLNQRFSLVTIANTISAFRRLECLQRGLDTWEKLVDWVKHVQLQKSEDLLKNLMDGGNKLAPETKARSLVLFVDAGLIELNSDFTMEVKEIFSPLKDIRSRNYASRDQCDHCLKVIVHILMESGRLDDPLVEVISPFIGEVINYIDKRLDEVNLEHFEKIECYVESLLFLSECRTIPLLTFVEMFKFAEKTVFSQNSNAAQKFYAMNIILIFIQTLISGNERLYLDKYAKAIGLRLIDENLLLGRLSKGTENSELSRNHQMSWGRLVSGYINSVWNILLICINAGYVTVSDLLGLIPLDDFVAIATNAIESGGREALATVLNVTKAILLHSKLEPALYKRFFQFSLESSFEHRKVSSFWPSIKAWVGMVFMKHFICEPELEALILEVR